METKLYFIELLSAYINKKKPPTPNNIDWDEIIRLARIHSVYNMVYISLSKLDEKPEIFDYLRKRFIVSSNYAIQQEIWTEKVIDAFNKNNIDHLFIKGYVLRNYYPNKEARTFGDIDILINESDRKKSHEIIQSLGFEYEDDDYIEQVWSYIKGPVKLEIHSDVIYDELFDNSYDFDYIEYFREKMKNRKLVSGCTYELRKEDHFIYIIVHLAKHFYNAGVGIRMIMDIAVFIKHFGGSLDTEYISCELKRLKLDSLANIVYFICKKYFSTDVSCSSINEADEIAVTEYIINHGVFGFNDKDVINIDFNKTSKSRLGMIKSKFFPDYDYMVKYYKWFEKGSRIMLPYAWARRLFGHITNKELRGDIGEKFGALVSESDDAITHNKILNIVGLKK